jgi:hypothetical protein
VKDSVVVGMLHRFRNRPYVCRRLQSRERMFASEFREIRTIHPIHRKPRQPVGLTDIMNRNDSGMIQPCRSFRFGTESTLHTGCSEVACGEHLHRDDSVEFLLACPIDDSHPATSDLLQELIISQDWQGTVCGSQASLD